MPDFDLNAALDSRTDIPKDFACPDGLSPGGVQAWEAIVTLLQENADLRSGGHKHVFYSPAAWRARGEEYGLESELVILHDGGNHAAYFSYDHEDYSSIEEMRLALAAHGLFCEACTGWYSAVYKI